jgi:hypothetical protein
MKELVDITVDEVSLVDKAANKKKFAFMKRDQEQPVVKNEDQAKKDLEARAAAEAEEKHKQEEAAKAQEAKDAADLQETLGLVEDATKLTQLLAQL